MLIDLGLAKAVKEGFEHTNPARVKMSPDESMEDKTKDLLPPSDKDIEKIQEKEQNRRKPPKEENLIVLQEIKKCKKIYFQHLIKI
jgi:hypothetical protein